MTQALRQRGNEHLLNACCISGTVHVVYVITCMLIATLGKVIVFLSEKTKSLGQDHIFNLASEPSCKPSISNSRSSIELS